MSPAFTSCPPAARLAIALSLTLCAGGASLLEQRIDEIIRSSKALAPGAIGVHAIQLRSGKLLYERNPAKLFTPASNTKLFSTALALTRLGPAHRLTTRLYADAPAGQTPAGQTPAGQNGVVPGDLRLYGGGDPSMSDRAIPYQKDSPAADPLAAIEEFAQAAVTAGVREIAGDVVGDDTAYLWEPYPPGWSSDDAVWEYGAPVSALTLNHGVTRVTVRGGKTEGDAASISVWPAVEYFTFANHVRTVASGEQRVIVDRTPGSREVLITGTILAGKAVAHELAVDDPALFTATALYEALLRRGIVVHGRPVARHRDPGEMPRAAAGVVLFERQSPPLLELLRVIDKVSQNLWAELMLREVGRARASDGSRKAGLDELKAFLAEIGVTKESYVFEDASGLSRLTLVSPDALTRLLRFMYLSPQSENWRALLPVAGVDGTLGKRFNGAAAAKGIAAKTGSLSHVNSLAGYADSATYGEVAFSIIVNHTNGPASEVRAAIDKIGLALLE